MIKSVQTVAVVMRGRNGNDPIGCGFGAGRASEFDISCDRLMSSTYSEKVLTSWGKRRCHIVRGIAITLVTVTDCIGVSYADDAPAWGLFRPATCWRPELAKTKPALSPFSSSFSLFFSNTLRAIGHELRLAGTHPLPLSLFGGSTVTARFERVSVTTVLLPCPRHLQR